MKNIKKLFALALAMLVLTTGMTGCNKNDDDKKKHEVEINTELDVPVGGCEGKTFTMYLAMPTFKGSYIVERTGEPVQDAIGERNALVEAHTGVDLVFVSTTRTSTEQAAEDSLIRTLIQAGDTTYDAYVHAQRAGMQTLVEEELFVDWNTIPHINLDNPWWYSNVERDICFGDKVFFMTGDYNIESFASTECLLFNKTMCDELDLEYPYQHVFDGTWTHDKFVEYIKAATSDLNGDGSLNFEDDRFGFGGWYYEQLPALFAGYGGATLAKDDRNLPVLNLNNERAFKVIDKMIEVFDNDGAFFVTGTFGFEDNMFNDGRLLFNDSFFGHVIGARSLENIDVGFVPYPKLDEIQEEYYSRTANISGLTYIPITNQDLDKTGAVLEAMAYYSSVTTMPAYFDIVLTIKSTRDIESEKMIPIIRNSSRYLDIIIGTNGSAIVAEGNGNTLASLVAGQQEAWESRLESVIELYTK